MNPKCPLIKYWWAVLLVFLAMKLERNGIMGCLESEREALMRLKEALNHPNGSSLPSWSGHNDCCNWERVICDNSTNRVTQLLLNNTRPYAYDLSDMQWSLDASCFVPFEELHELDLSDNHLAGLFGKIKLNNLQWLVLRSNKLTRIPSFGLLLSIHTSCYLSSSSKLEELNIGDNYLTGSLPDSIMNLTSLKYLNFSGNYLNGSLPREGSLCKLKNLISLDLRANNFMGNIPNCLANLSSLRLLDVSSNDFEGPLPSSIIYSLRSLASVDLRGNHFKGSISFTLLANHSNLQIFYIGSKSQQDIKVETENPPFVPKFQLKIFKVANCTLNEPTHTIPTFLYYQHDLRMLSFGHSKMVGSFPNWLLVNNTKLIALNLTNNNVTGPIELKYYPTSKSSPTMHIFDVSSNPIGGEIPPQIGFVFPNLITLNMSSCSLWGGFPASLGYMRQLTNLDLAFNNLSGFLPHNFGKDNNDLKFLKLSNNNLRGSFLPVGSNFTNLLYLNLANNKFMGNVPDGIMNNSALRVLDLSNNRLHGEIPSWIGNIHNLTFLVLSKNMLQGPIPLGFCKLTGLVYLDLSYNNLSGTLPSCVNMSLLSYLHLQGNQLNGPIPTTLAKSHALLTLDLAKNKFSNQIPKWIGSLVNLRILILRGNRLEGPIPLNICHLKSISILDLSRNNLFGRVPSCFNNVTFGRLDSFYGMGIGKLVVKWDARAIHYFYDPKTNEFLEDDHYLLHFIWYEEQEVNFMSKSRYELYKGDILNFMSGLDLSRNKLTSYIPPQIGCISNLHSLNLSNNHLIGFIPETFSNLKQIESLDLSHNTLCGRIPSKLATLYFLSVFSVAYNNLSGKTPERVFQFATFDATSYKGNPLLCGSPLEQICLPIAKPPSVETHSHRQETDFKETFIWSFIGSFVVAFLTVIVVLYFKLYFYIPGWDFKK